MKAIHNTAFLCGSFSIKNKIKSFDSKWKKVMPKDEKSVLERYYYPEFVEFCYPAEGQEKNGMQCYSLSIDKNIEVNLRGKRHAIFVKDIEIFILPYNLFIYAIRVTQDGADLNDITLSLSILRNISEYKDELIKDSWGEILEPVVEIYRSAGDVPDSPFQHFDLMENGNKLKLFQIVEIESSKLTEKEQDELLFELGTLAHVDSYNSGSFTSPSQEYFDRIMKHNKISIFNNWKGLSLFDTFTVLSYPTHQYLLDNWTNYYFGMIYIHSLFLKFYLFRMNILFRKKTIKASSLEKEFLNFELNCCFHKISYNFLPLEIYQSLDVGLEINEERKQLFRMIEQEKNIQEKEGDRKLNNILLFLTGLTVFSAIWDFTCLLNQLYPYDELLGSTIGGFRIVTYILLLTVIVIFIVNRFARAK